ncbi:hypothetical protein SLEP1_g8675 [Rubroshorea leprosula]|uniref:TFIIE beta domain-containing protein n=1 Tax=Rubroshorea leprosula TaxID=152421 RepID=A0AAV5I2I0_9ROSI|nr:hypothetical protein SLEP1_g8675 [Rubroshorea leprosula]
MELQEKLDRFRKQQEKCQSTLTSIAAKSGSLRVTVNPKSEPMTTSPLPSARSPAPAVKFSNDTDRFQHINTIRKGPVGRQMKRVLDLLLQTRQALTAEQINEACFVDVNGNKDVFQSLRNNPKVHYDGKCFSYKAMYDVKSKSELLALIRKFTEGIDVSDLKDSYPNVMENLQALKAGGQIWLLSNLDSQDIAYPNDPKFSIKVENDIKELFFKVHLPQDMHEIEKDLQKNGINPATNTAQRRAAAVVQGIAITKTKPKKKSKDLRYIKNLTNKHLVNELGFLK